MIDFELMDHQKKAIALSSTERDMFLAWDMGTGKTCATIQMIRERCKEFGRLRKVLILCPKVVVGNWRKELEMFSNIKKEYTYALTGPVKKRAQFFEGMKDYALVAITNYDALQNKELCEAILKWGPEILVCDESHYLKSYKSKRAKNAAQIADVCQHRYLLSGTPILNNALDLFMQYRILDGYLGKRSTFGHNFFAFRSTYFMDKNASWNNKAGHFPEWVPRPGGYEKLMSIISKKTLRIEKKDCLDLPPLTVMNLDAEMGPKQRSAYNEMRKNFITYIEDKACVAQLAITKALRLQQIVSGFVKTDEGEVIRFDKVPRLELLREQLEQLTPSHKVIVWACFRENYKMIREVCNELGIESVEIHGDVGQKDREEAIRSFNDEDRVRVLIGNQGAGGIGVNLVSASYSIYYSRGFKLGDDLQSEARNYRRGSEIHDKITRINLVAPGTIDEMVSDALSSKLDLSNLFLDYIKKKGTKYGI